ncbi:MAG: hypothetical protein WAM14_17470 [Candidatus Nitrosopolaris sp.]
MAGAYLIETYCDICVRRAKMERKREVEVTISQALRMHGVIFDLKNDFR